MRQMISGISTSPNRLTSQITQAKATQDNTTARMGSDRVGVFGTADPDFIGFLTPPFKTMLPVTIPSGNGSYGTVAVLPEQQHATLEDRYYKAGTPFLVDRTGTATTGLNILRSGTPPAGYYGGDKWMVQKREKVYFRNDRDFNYIWQIKEVRREARGYSIQTDERLDGDFFPGSIYLGVSLPYGWTFPVGDNGNLLYNNDPYTDAGWGSAPNSAPNNDATKPVIDSISLSSYVLGSGDNSITISGRNFTDAAFALVGPFRPVGSVFSPRPLKDYPTGDISETTKIAIEPDGAYYYRYINAADEPTTGTVAGTLITISIPGPDWVAGVFDITVVGNDGQIARLEKAFTISEATS